MSMEWKKAGDGTVGHDTLVADERDVDHVDHGDEPGITVDFTFHVTRGRHGARRLREGAEPPPPVGEGKVPRLAKLMALAIRFEELVRAGEVKDFAEIAALGHVTKARVAQIANLSNLAPDIQEEILFLPKVRGDREMMAERHVRAIALEPDWAKQREMWGELKAEWSGGAQR
jgi:hypothetical protein